jgi:Fur family ferric uptake transcriptional regulator
MPAQPRHPDAILDLLSLTGRFHSARQMHADLHRRGHPVGVTTVYRTLRELAAVHAVDVITRHDGIRYFRRCGHAEHYHLVCRGCGSTVELPGAEVRTWASTLALRHGYRDIELQLQLSGWCAGCTRAPATADASMPVGTGWDEPEPTA